MQRGPEGVVMVAADMSISFALHFYLQMSPLIFMFSTMGIVLSAYFFLLY
jgi:hypothetical protein